MMPESIKHVVLGDHIWNSAIDEASGKLYLDVRKGNETIELVQLDLSSMIYEEVKVEHSRWTQLLGAADGKLYFVEYIDHHNPNTQKHSALDWSSKEMKAVETMSSLSNSALHPAIYEHGSDYHKTVAKFLSLDLPLSCEYLEWKEKIIISYYLRSDNEFERHLLLLKNEEKEWRLCQDSRMKGFSPGSFFVFKDYLIFIKDQNEVCVYTE
ncbi:MAG: hypothetical protein ABJG47_00230 [Ekhidna sp.]